MREFRPTILGLIFLETDSDLILTAWIETAYIFAEDFCPPGTPMLNIMLVSARMHVRAPIFEIPAWSIDVEVN